MVRRVQLGDAAILQLAAQGWVCASSVRSSGGRLFTRRLTED